MRLAVEAAFKTGGARGTGRAVDEVYLYEPAPDATTESSIDGARSHQCEPLVAICCVAKTAVFDGRVGQSEDPDAIAMFLTDGGASSVISQCYNLDGGQWMS